MNEQAPARPYPRFWQAFRLLFALLALEILLSLAAGDARRDPPIRASIRLLAYGIVLFWGLRRTRVSVREVFPFRAFRPGLVIATVLGILGVAMLGVEASYLLSQVMPEPDRIRAIRREADAGMAGAVQAVLIAPLVEELLHRGLILRGFLATYSRGRAVFLSALLFGLIHLNPWQLLPAFAGGLLLGWWRASTGSLWPCLAGHMIYNAVPTALQAFLSAYPHPPLPATPELSLGQQLVVIAVGCTLLGAGAVLFRRSAATRKPLPAAGPAPI